MDTKGYRPFSQDLQTWLKSRGPKTLLSLDSVFAEKGFAVTLTLLMAIAALPVPTGGLTHIFGFISIIIAIQVLIGRRNLWIPKRWRGLKISPAMRTKLLPALIRLVRWLEKYSRPRMASALQSQLGIRFYGLIVFVFSVFVTLSPPFSGLDTLPAMGVVFTSLAIILEDFYLFLVGIIVGSVGVCLTLFLGVAAFELFYRML